MSRPLRITRRRRRRQRSTGEVTFAVTLEDHYAAKLAAISQEHGLAVESIAAQCIRNDLLRRPAAMSS